MLVSSPPRNGFDIGDGVWFLIVYVCGSFSVVDLYSVENRGSSIYDIDGVARLSYLAFEWWGSHDKWCFRVANFKVNVSCLSSAITKYMKPGTYYLILFDEFKHWLSCTFLLGYSSRLVVFSLAGWSTLLSKAS
ncbi:hypothetical protein TorRG33x02_355800, partial [Trema orientale]